MSVHAAKPLIYPVPLLILGFACCFRLLVFSQCSSVCWEKYNSVCVHIISSNPCTISKVCFKFVLQSRRLRLIRWFSQKQPEWCRQRSSWSLYLFPPESRLAFFSPLSISSVNAAPHLDVLGLTHC